MDATVYMEAAMEDARPALAQLEVPLGCVIVENGQVLARGSNATNHTRNATRHNQMEAIDNLLNLCRAAHLTQQQVAQRFAACELYVTCEPCIMCAADSPSLGSRVFSMAVQMTGLGDVGLSWKCRGMALALAGTIKLRRKGEGLHLSGD